MRRPICQYNSVKPLLIATATGIAGFINEVANFGQQPGVGGFKGVLGHLTPPPKDFGEQTFTLFFQLQNITANFGQGVKGWGL